MNKHLVWEVANQFPSDPFAGLFMMIIAASLGLIAGACLTK